MNSPDSKANQPTQAVIKRFLQRTLPLFAGAVLVFAALYLASSATNATDGIGVAYLWILFAALAASAILFLAVAARVIQLIQRLRQSYPGARLTVRLLVLFIALSVPPAAIVYWFSLDFLTDKIDKWFDVEVETALGDALTIAQSFLAVQEGSADSQVRRFSRRLETIPQRELFATLSELITESGADELTLFGRANRVIASSSSSFSGLLPPRPPQELDVTQARRTGSYVDTEPSQDGGLQIRVVTLVSPLTGGDDWVLQGVFPVTPEFNEQAVNVEREFEHYDTLKYLQTHLKRSFILILSLVMLLSVLISALLAFNTARKLVRPVSRLANATKAIAAGDYQGQLAVPSQDELGFLVESFNVMTREVAQASAEATSSRREAESRRDYLEAVLSRLSSGVISFDTSGKLLTANRAAAQILSLDMEAMQGRPLTQICEESPRLQPLADLVTRMLTKTPHEWREELQLESASGKQILMCRGAQLVTDQGVGQVVVFDDLTDLVRAQREAAWGEVARRLAHEVKNPLTPIQLAAERLRYKYLDKMPEKDANVLDRSTQTIVSQVEALKTMVNAFSEYAKAPELSLQKLTLSEVVEEVLELYRQANNVDCQRDWMANEPLVMIDRGRIRQLLHNVIKNAQEATDGKLVLELSNRVRWIKEKRWLDLSIQDNGPGLPSEIIDKLFEPYATTKQKGTGIGLAIVRKIAEEHGGSIDAGNAENGGAVFTLHLPLDPAELNFSQDLHQAKQG